MSRKTTHLAVAVAALVAGGAASATLFASADPVRNAATASAPPAPEQVRTEVVTRTIHRVRHVHRRHRGAAAASAPPAPRSVAPAPAPTPVVGSAVRTSTPVAVVRTRRTTSAQRPLQTRSSGQAGEREDEHEQEFEHEDEGADD